MRFLRIYQRVLGQLAAERRLAWLLAGGNVVVAALQFLDPLLFGRVIQLLARSDGLAAAAVWAQAVPLLGLWLAVGAAGIGVNMVTSLHADRMAHRCRLRALTDYFNHVLALPLSFHGETQSGRLLKTMLSGADQLFGTWLMFFREQCAVMVAMAVLLPLTVLLNWRLGLCLIALTAVFAALAFFVIRRTEAGQRRAQQHHSALGGAAHDALANVMVVQSFTRMRAEAARLQELAAHVLAHQFPVLNWWAVAHVLTRAASTLAVIAMVMIGTALHLRGAASVGEIVAFMGLASLLIGRLEAAMQFTANLFSQMPVLEDFFAGLDAESQVPERPGAPPLRVAGGEVAFEHVRFAYPGGPDVLDDVSFTVPPGRVVALVGQTGAGKSTAIALLQRLWDPQAGTVRIDGQDLRDVTLDSLRGAVGVVFQDSLLFRRSIADNLRIGRPEATPAQLEHACRLADAHEFILRQPQGYETMVGERGASLSGGQRQRLAIARALLKDPRILLLDEATSALDAATEARVSRAMAALMRGRTTLVIAHRLSTVRDADEILVFAGGRIVERGSFAELLARGGPFSELVATQLTGAGPALAA
jgi:ATP-binding cassette subfamily B protein